MFLEDRENIIVWKKRDAYNSVMEDMEEQENPFGIFNELWRGQQQIIQEQQQIVLAQR